MRIIVSTILCLLMACMSGTVSATTETWVAARATSQVAYTTDKETWIPLRKGMEVPNKAWISTGPRGRLQLVRGTESIAFQPNTLAAVITRGSDINRKTEVVQQVGEISLEIEKRQQPHTTVQTPFLAAVVKGTKFTVEVTETDAAVAVDRGLVEVTSFGSGERSDLGAGQGARVDTSGMTVAGLSGKPDVTRAAPSKPAVPARSAKGDAPKSEKAGKKGPEKSIAEKSKADKAGGAPDKGKSTSKGDAGGKGEGKDKGNSGGKGNGRGNDSDGGKGGGHGKGGGNGKGGGKGGRDD
ncbi:hypothetical protein HNR26_003478 [Rhizobium rosettiformans]|uniref:FecR protein domain-containing protein n=2 Tax=Rhizobium rosettiformans TaxID=1368430 RepID=A0A4S8PRM2_9HYPH|nr:FecR domain-containing protein [Rhizobium rosettiformans]MBB5277398.1 hypothetical protein [Rhizobium rosettiformans]THV33868.1 hypothetical protein FAA86_17770 [Rhizobium rosettiformans W3]